jgi:hypothetical protein
MGYFSEYYLTVSIYVGKWRAKDRDKKTHIESIGSDNCLSDHTDRESETLGDGMCSCFYLRLSKQLLGGLGTRLADEVADMIVRIKRSLSTCCYSQPPEPPGK